MSTIDELEKSDIYYAMAIAYDDNSNQKKAVDRVLELHPTADALLLEDLWSAIDAYVDVQPK